MGGHPEDPDFELETATDSGDFDLDERPDDEGLEAEPTTPRGLDAESTTPRGLDAESTTPRALDADSTTPRALDADSTTPRGLIAERTNPRALSGSTRVTFRSSDDRDADDLAIQEALEEELYQLDGLDDIPDFGLESGQFTTYGARSDDDEIEIVVADGNPWASFTGNVRTTSHVERIEEAQVVLGLLQGFLQSSSALEELENELTEVSALAARLAGLDPGDERDELSDSIDGRLAAFEERLLETERKVPGSWLRRKFDSQDMDEATLAHYLRFQLEHLDATPECWSRIDLIVTRLTRRKVRDDYFMAREPDKLVELWNGVLPPSTVSARIRNAAVEFFANATARLADFTDAEELFTSGFYVDVAGYKISLRLHYFDPVILYAAAKTNIALHNWLAAQESSGRNLGALSQHFTEAHDQIRNIFARQDEDYEAIARFRARMAGAKAPEPEPEPERPTDWKQPLQTPKHLWRRLALVGAFVAAAAITLPVVLDYFEVEDRDLDAMSSAEARTIHPLLIKGSLGGEPQSLFVGELDSAGWVVLTKRQKRAEVEQMMSTLRGRGLDSALIYREGVIAVHVVDGNIRVLE